MCVFANVCVCVCVCRGKQRGEFTWCTVVCVCVYSVGESSLGCGIWEKQCNQRAIVVSMLACRLIPKTPYF